MISIFTLVLLIQVLLFVINAVGAKTINEVVSDETHDSVSQHTKQSLSYGSSQPASRCPRAKMHKTNASCGMRCYD